MQRMKGQALKACPWGGANRLRLLLVCRPALRCRPGKYRVLMRRVLLHQDGESDGCDHEHNGAPAGCAREQVGRRAGSEGCLRALAAEGSRQVGALALLQENDSDQEQANKNVNCDKQINHAVAFLSGILGKLSDILGAEGGT